MNNKHLIAQKIYSPNEIYEVWNNQLNKNQATLKIEIKDVIYQNWRFKYFITGNDTIWKFCHSSEIGLSLNYGKDQRGSLVWNLIDNEDREVNVTVNMDLYRFSISENREKKELYNIDAYDFRSLQNISHSNYSRKEVRDNCRLLYRSLVTAGKEEYKFFIVNQIK
jgi:hypothetical protein